MILHIFFHNVKSIEAIAQRMSFERPVVVDFKNFGQEQEKKEAIDARQKILIPIFLQKRYREGNYPLEALYQYYPQIEELQMRAGDSNDPTGERDHVLEAESTSVISVHPNRALLLLTSQCVGYCRFCFRRDIVAPEIKRPENINKKYAEIIGKRLNTIIDIVKKHPEVDDVILSGGDPLSIPNKLLLPFLEKLLEMKNISTIRIDSRAVSVDPDRINEEFATFLKDRGKNEDGISRFSYFAHMNHPADLDHPKVKHAISKLKDAGLNVYNQGVILKGVNDNPETMKKLWELCGKNQVIPYDLYILDHVPGAAHFEVSDEDIIKIYATLHKLSGTAVPDLIFVNPLNNKKVRTKEAEPKDIRNFLRRRKRAIKKAIKNKEKRNNLIHNQQLVKN